MTEQTKPTTSNVIKNYNFRMLWIGQGTSMLGDQFFMIALPWLVLKLTDDALALGVVLALIGIPRAVFMLVGGAVTDRYTPRGVMLGSDILRLVLTVLLTIMILTGWMHIGVLYVMAFLFGVISGFFSPASGAIMPLVVRPEELVISNSLYQGTTYLCNFIGPVLAGGLIALFAHRTTSQGSDEMAGIAAAMAFDALTFLVSVVTLVLMRVKEIQMPQVKATERMLKSIQAGVEYVWRDGLLRTVFILLVAANFLFVGPILVGIPVLSNTRLAGGAAAYGTIMGAFGGGNLVGILLTSNVLRVVGKRMGGFVVTVIASFGVGQFLIGFASSTAVVFMILFVLGIGNGVLAITLMTSLQRQTPTEMLGRVMSLVMLASVGLVPVSQALCGAFIKLSLSGVFVAAGILMLLVAVWLAAQPATRTMNQLLEAGIPAESEPAAR